MVPPGPVACREMVCSPGFDSSTDRYQMPCSSASAEPTDVASTRTWILAPGAPVPSNGTVPLSTSSPSAGYVSAGGTNSSAAPALSRPRGPNTILAER